MIIQPDKETRNVNDLFYESERKRIDMLNREFFHDVELTKKENDVLVWLCGWDNWTIETIIDVIRKIKKGDVVEYEIGEGTTGREQAVNVTPILTVKSIIESLKKENLMLKTMTDGYGVKKYLVVNADDVLQTDENGMTLVETAAYVGIDVEGLE